MKWDADTSGIFYWRRTSPFSFRIRTEPAYREHYLKRAGEVNGDEVVLEKIPMSIKLVRMREFVPPINKLRNTEMPKSR